MIKSFCLFLLIIFLPGYIFSQTAKIDSLKRNIILHKNDSVACLSYAELCRSYERSQPDSALYFGQQGLMMAKKLNYLRGEIKNTIAIGRVYTNLGNAKIALQLLMEAKAKAEKINDLSSVAACLNNIGRTYTYDEDIITQLEYCKKSNSVARSINDEFWIGVTSLNIGIGYAQTNKLDSAIFYLNISYDYGKNRLRIPEMTGFSLMALGNVYKKQEQKTLALEYYKSALEFLQKDLVYDAMAETYMYVSEYYNNTGQSDSSFYYARKALSFAQKCKQPDLVIMVAKNLIPKYESIGRIDSAYYYQKLCSDQKDSLYNSEKRQFLQQFSFEQWRQNDKEATAKLHQEEEKKQNLQYWIIAVSLIVFTSLVLLLSQSIIINEKWIGFFGILGLLLFFEFLNLILHPFLGKITHHSPLLMLICMVIVAAILIPLHHKIEHWVKHKLVEKNKRIRLAMAKKIIRDLEGSEQTD